MQKRLIAGLILFGLMSCGSISKKNLLLTHMPESMLGTRISHLIIWQQGDERQELLVIMEVLENETSLVVLTPTGLTLSSIQVEKDGNVSTNKSIMDNGKIKPRYLLRDLQFINTENVFYTEAFESSQIINEQGKKRILMFENNKILEVYPETDSPDILILDNFRDNYSLSITRLASEEIR